MVTLGGRVNGLTKSPVLDVSFSLRHFVAGELSRWIKLPEGLAWQVDELRAKVQGTPESPKTLQADATLAMSGLQTVGVKADRISLHTFLHDGQLKVDHLDVTSGANTLSAEASTKLPEEWSDAAAAAGSVRWKISSPKCEEWFAQSPPVSGAIDSEGTVRVEDGKFTGADARISSGGLRVAGIDITSLAANIESDAKLLGVKKLEVRLGEGNNVALNGSLGLDDRKSVDVRYSADVGNFETLAATVAVPVLSQARGNVKLAGEMRTSIADVTAKRMDGIIASATVEADALRWNGAAAGSLSLAASCADGKATLGKLDLRPTGSNHIAISGDTLIAEPMNFHASVAGDLPSLSEFNDLLKSFGAAPIESGAVRISWQGTGGKAISEIRGSGEIGITGFKMPGMPDPLSLNVRTTHDGTRAEIAELNAVSGQWRAKAEAALSADELKLASFTLHAGEVKLAEGSALVPLALAQEPRPSSPVDLNRELSIRLKTEPLDLPKLLGIVGMKSPVKGVLRGDVDVHGTLHAPDGRVGLSLSDVTADVMKGRLDPAQVSLDARIAPDSLTLDASVLQKPLEPLTAHVTMPLDVSKLMAEPGALMATSVEAVVKLPDSGLAVVQKFEPDLVNVRGTFGAEVSAKGPLREPQLNGSLHLDVPVVTFRQPEYPEGKNVKVRVSFSGRRVALSELSGLLSGGEVKASGSVDLTNASDPAIDLRLDAKEALVMRNETASLRTNASLGLKGTMSRSHLGGSVDLVRGRVFKEIEFLPLSLPNQLPPPPPPAKRSMPGAGLPKPFADWTLGVDVRTRDPIRLMGNVLNGGVVVALKADGTLGKPEIEGKVSLDDARLRLPFSRLAISRGNLIFTKERPVEPELDLQADALVNDYEVTLFGTGSALEPKLRFTSSPPLAEGDIATLLATGATAGDLGSSEGAAANRAAFLVITKLYRSLFHKAVTNRYDDEPPKISVDFSALNVGSTQRSVTVTYELNKHLQAKGSMNADGSFRGLFYYLIRFK